jgi:hypothetical protein
MITLENPALPLLAPLVILLGLSLSMAIAKRIEKVLRPASFHQDLAIALSYIILMLGIPLMAQICYVSWQDIVAQTEPMSHELQIALGEELAIVCLRVMMLPLMMCLAYQMLRVRNWYERRLIVNELIRASADD